MTNVIHEFPPNIEKVAARLPDSVRTPGVVFAYDGSIYFPQGADGVTFLPQDIIVHENVHFVQQAANGGAEPWWDLYLVDVEFRLEQEIEAYRAQLEYIDAHNNRDSRRWYLKEITRQLSSSLYGNILSPKQAKARLTAKHLDS